MKESNKLRNDKFTIEKQWDNATAKYEFALVRHFEYKVEIFKDPNDLFSMFRKTVPNSWKQIDTTIERGDRKWALRIAQYYGISVPKSQ